jgi:ABC-2 type transport system permease protein
MWALYAREVKRFQKIWMDTVFSPIVSMGLYLAVFGIVLQGREVGGFNYLAFIYTGLLAMVLVNGSFSNPGFSLIIAKNVGTIVDLQVAPISTWRIGVAYALAALTRGLITLLIAAAFTFWFIPGIQIAHPLLLIAVLLLNGFCFGLLGVAFGMWAKGFESLTFMTTFPLEYDQSL